jgi:hypothetical protein
MGLGRKVFTAGQILSAADVQGYLQDQAIMVFSGTAARSAAIGTPAPGMHTFRTDGTIVEVYNGGSWVSANSVGGGLIGSQLSGTITTAIINATNVVNTLTASTATAYTFTSSDQSSVLQFTNAGTVTATVGTATALTAGQRIDVVADGAAGVRITAGSGVAFAGAGQAGTVYTIPQFDAATILCVGSNAYRIIGNITSV